MKIFQIAVSCLLLVATIISCDGCSNKTIEPVDPPQIAEFGAQPTDIMPGDSTLLSYRVIGAASLTLYPGGISLSPLTTGETYVSPAVPTEYSLVAVNDDGQDSSAVAITMSGAVASFEQFDISAERILAGDSVTLTWHTDRADSVVIGESGLRLHASVLDSGQVTFSPTTNSTYIATAYGSIGNGTASQIAIVETPFAVEAVFGTVFKTTLGTGVQSPSFRFRVVDAIDQALRIPWLKFSILEGDGYLTVDSAQADAQGLIYADYISGGVMSYAVVRAMVTDVDTLDVKIRASALEFAPETQGQYIKIGDTYADVVALNGDPDRVDDKKDGWFNYAVYEQTLGLVLYTKDINENSQFDANDTVVEIFVNTRYSDTTTEGIGIGSTIQEVRDAYGLPDTTFVDTTTPAAEELWYYSLGALFYAEHADADSSIIEIHLWEPVAGGAAPGDLEIKTKASQSSYETEALRQYRRR